MGANFVDDCKTVVYHPNPDVQSVNNQLFELHNENGLNTQFVECAIASNFSERIMTYLG